MKTSVPLLMASTVSTARAMKEALIASTGPDDVRDIPCVVAWERGPLVIGVACASVVDRDAGVSLAGAGIIGYGADAVTFIGDSFDGPMTHPVTGRQWDSPRERELYFRAHPEEPGWRDILLAMRVTRSGRVQHVLFPYVCEGGSVTWLPQEERGMPAGQLLEDIREAFGRKTALEAAMSEFGEPPYSKREAQRHIDTLVTGTLAETGAVFMVAPGAREP